MFSRTTDSVSAADARYATNGAATARTRAATARANGDQAMAAVQDRQAKQLTARAAEIKANRVNAGIDPR